MTPPPTSPTPAPISGSRTGRLGLVILIAVAVFAVGFGLYYLFLRPAGPAAVADATLPPVGTAAPNGATATDAGATGGTATTDPGAGSATGIDGTWEVDTSIGSFSDFSDSFVGYRVQEELAGIGANTAVGRTPDVSGSMTIAGTTVSEATIEADLTTLQSDDRNRDRQLGRQGIQTDQFPTASLAITEPIELGSIPADGQEIEVTVKGQLTLHGQTRDVEVPMKARLSGDVIAVSGSIPIAFADYGMEKPESFKVLSVDDQGTMEFQVFFSRA
ncbi:MAG TPA: YceI family protein [Candidatus Saccharimonadia bacterium]|nr:YceI family protein [Candidatus Saccharimonadia bacterium]